MEGRDNAIIPVENLKLAKSIVNVFFLQQCNMKKTLANLHNFWYAGIDIVNLFLEGMESNIFDFLYWGKGGLYPSRVLINLICGTVQRGLSGGGG